MSERTATEQADLPAGTQDVVRFAEQHPEVFQSIVELVAENSLAKAQHRRTSEYTDTLVDRHAKLTSPANLAPGDLVTWKSGMKNRKRPAYDEPGIVVEVLKEPVHARPDQTGSAYFREPLNILIGLLDEDDEFIVYHFDSRRFDRFHP